MITTPDERVVAYATLTMTTVARSAAPPDLGKGAPLLVPAVLLGRRAVDERYEGLGIATSLVATILQRVLEIIQDAACRAVVVTAINDDALRWWLRFGFHPFDPNDPDCLDRYLLTDEIATVISLKP